MSALRHLISIVGGCALAFNALANIELSSTAPQSYTVRQGDTLWDISSQFLREPWRWQEIWRGNPQIKNPDLIYPGDVLHLVFEGGKPAIRLSRTGRPVVKLSPRVRFGPARAGFVPTIPIDAITPFLSQPLVVGETELDTAPYIVSLGTEHLVGGSGDGIYVRGLGDRRSRRFTVLRRGDPYVDADGEVLGYAALHIADAALQAGGDPATMKLLRARREVLIGDRVLPATDDRVISAFMPHPPTAPVRGRILSVIEGVTQIGQYQVVVLNVGEGQGMDPGTVLAVYQQGVVVTDPLALDPSAPLPEPDAEIEYDPDRQRGLDGLTMALDRMARDVVDLVTPADDSYRNVTLPERRAGTLMVFRTFDRLSYALVMDASLPMHSADVVTNP